MGSFIKNSVLYLTLILIGTALGTTVIGDAYFFHNNRLHPVPARSTTPKKPVTKDQQLETIYQNQTEIEALRVEISGLKRALRNAQEENKTAKEEFERFKQYFFRRL